MGFLLISQSGCYYGHLAEGQIRLLWNRQPLEEASQDTAHSRDVRALLGLVEEVRQFGGRLGLEVKDQYTSYVDWPKDRIVTTLVRTRGDRLESVPWWYPMLGQLPYRGYFDRAQAEAEAERLRQEEGFDVCISGVAAYSTLGWLDDPVTRPMLTRGAANLVETLFHELVHATAFFPGEAEFNEGVAQFIGQQAAIRFFAAQEDPGQSQIRHASTSATTSPSLSSWPSADRVRASIDDRRRIAETTLAFKERVAELDGAPDRATRRAELEAEARTQLAQLPLSVIDANAVAQRARLSDACLVLRGAYVEDGPRHAAVLAALGDDLPAMLSRLRIWAEEERPLEAFFEVAEAKRDASPNAP